MFDEFVLNFQLRSGGKLQLRVLFARGLYCADGRTPSGLSIWWPSREAAALLSRGETKMTLAADLVSTHLHMQTILLAQVPINESK